MFFANFNSVEDVFETIKEIYRQPSELKKIEARARETIVNEYSMEVASRRLQNLHVKLSKMETR